MPFTAPPVVTVSACRTFRSHGQWGACEWGGCRHGRQGTRARKVVKTVCSFATDLVPIVTSSMQVGSCLLPAATVRHCQGHFGV
jgi:hypothetical protein